MSGIQRTPRYNADDWGDYMDKGADHGATGGDSYILREKPTATIAGIEFAEATKITRHPNNRVSIQKDKVGYYNDGSGRRTIQNMFRDKANMASVENLAEMFEAHGITGTTPE